MVERFFKERGPLGSIAFLLFALVACGRSTQSNDRAMGGAGKAGGAGGNGGVGGGNSGTAGTTSAASGAGGSGGSLPIRELGQVSVLSLSLNGGPQTVGHAIFWPVGSASSCDKETIGDCEVSTCPDLGEDSYPDAGEITIASSAFEMTLLPADNGLYASYFSLGPLPQGEVLSIAAEGNDVPAFSEMLSAPEAIGMTGPSELVKYADGYYQIDPASDVVLTWVRGAPGVIAYVQTSQAVDGGSLSLLCRVDSTAGAMTISSSALGAFSPGTVLQLFTLATDTVAAGDYDVTAYVGTEILDMDDAPVGLRLPGAGGTGGTSGTNGQ